MIKNKIHQARIKPLAVAIAIAVSPTAVFSAPDDTFLNFANSTAALVNGVDFNFVCNTSNMNAGKEFRMCDPTGALGGGLPTKKDTINGTEVWRFDSTTRKMSSVANTVSTTGIGTLVAAGVDGGSILPTADRNGGPAVDQGAKFFGSIFGFLAPFVGSEAVTAGSPNANDTGYGAATISFDVVNNEVTIFYPVLEAQWAGTHFLLGFSNNAGVTFKGPITNIVTDGIASGVTSFDFKISAEHVITPEEDAGAGGFAGWSPEWVMVGSGGVPNFVFTPPISPTASIVGGGAATVVATLGGPGATNVFADGRITLAESEAAFGVDTGADLGAGSVFADPCNGSCFDFTVTGLTGAANEKVQVVLPLTGPIPANAVYRKYNATLGWHTFDESAGDTLESGAGTGTPVDCSAAVFSAGLTSGDNCVRLTILNGGPNDNDGALDTTIQDPGGIASAVVPVDNTIPGQSIGDAEGCSVSAKPVSPLDKADWWIVAAFLSMLGFRKYRKDQA